MTLNKAMKHKTIKLGDIIRLTSDDKDIIVEVKSIGTNTMMTKDIIVFYGVCGNKTGNRGFYVDDNKTHEFKQVDKNKYPEYFL